MAGEPRDRGACDASQQGSGVLKLPSRVRFEVGDRGHPGDAETAGFGGGDADPAGSQQDRLTQYGGTGRDFGRSLTGERLGVDVPFAGDDEVSRAERNVEADQVKEEGGAAADARPEEGNGARRHAACGTSTGHARDVHRGFGAKEACQMAEASVEIEYVLVGGSLLPSEPVGRTVRAGERGGDVGCYDQAGFAQARIESRGIDAGYAEKSVAAGRYGNARAVEEPGAEGSGNAGPAVGSGRAADGEDDGLRPAVQSVADEDAGALGGPVPGNMP